MFSEFIRARLWLGLAVVALTGGGHAASIFDIQAAGQTAAPSWLETLVLGGPSQDGVLAVPGDQDHFRIAVTGPTPVAIYTSGRVDTTVRLYDPDGLEIAEDNSRIETILPRRGTYYVRVETYSGFFRSGLETGSYTLRAERLAAPTAISLGGSPQEGSISTRGEADYFRLQVTGPTNVAIYTTGGLDGEGTLLDPDGREIASDDDGGDGDNFRIEALLARRGTYYLRVEGYYSFSTGSYNLHAERLPEPTRLSPGGSPQEGTISTDGEVDYFQLQVTEPTAATIYTTGDFDNRATLLDPDGREIERNDDGGELSNFRIEAYLPRRGTYYLRVQGFLSRTGSYTLHAEWRLESPQTLALGGPTREGTISTGGEADYFRVVATGPMLASFYTSGDFDARGTLLDPDGREIASDDDTGEGLNFRIDTILPGAGTYFLRVEGPRFYARTGSYTLHAERLESPRPLSLGGSPQQGALLTNGEADFFSMAVSEPTAVAIHTTGGVDTGGVLYDPDGELIASDDDGGEGPNFRIDTILMRRGTYLLKILSSHPDSTGSYTLHAVGIGGGRVTAGDSGGSISPPAPPAAEFDLDPDNGHGRGIAFANGRLHVVDYDDDMVYVYDVSGQRLPAAEFDLEDRFSFGHGITFGSGRFYVADSVGDEVLVFDTSGQRVPAAEFDLDPDNADPVGITFANNRLYVVDGDENVYTYQLSGQRVPAAEFLLDRANDNPYGITFGNGRFFVVDSRDNKAYAYQLSGQHVPAADIDLKPDNYYPTGITFGNGRFFVVDGISEKVFTY